MGYISGIDRGQTSLLPARIEDYVAADAAVRVIDAFVDGLEVVHLGFRRAVGASSGNQLKRKQIISRERSVLYAAQAAACPLKQKCTTATRRHVQRHLDEDALARMHQRATPDMMRKRRCTAEHPFGTIKRMMAGERFLTRNLKGTRTEMTLSVLAYNIMRTMNMRSGPA